MKKQTILFLETYNKNPNKCGYCHIEILFKEGDKPSKIIKKKFCSKQCSIDFTIKTKTIKNYCKICGKLSSKKSEKCRSCYSISKNIIRNRELSFYTKDEKYLSSKCQDIRRDARKLMNKNSEKKCKYCSNNEFKDVLEVHHLKGILEFELNTKIKEINSLDNLIWICPSHHAMIEKGLLV